MNFLGLKQSNLISCISFDVHFIYSIIFFVYSKLFCMFSYILPVPTLSRFSTAMKLVNWVTMQCLTLSWMISDFRFFFRIYKEGSKNLKTKIYKLLMIYIISCFCCNKIICFNVLEQSSNLWQMHVEFRTIKRLNQFQRYLS